MPHKAPNLPGFEYLNQLDGVKLLRRDMTTRNESGMLKSPRKIDPLLYLKTDAFSLSLNTHK